MRIAPDSLETDGHRDGSIAASDEAALLQRARSGDRGAFARLVTVHQDRLYNTLVRMVGDREEARDLTQECFTRALDAIADFRGDSGVYTWLCRIGMNLAISRIRKVQRQRTFSLDSPRTGPANQASMLVERMSAGGEDPAEAAERHERAQQVLAALGRLDAEYRAVLVMRDIDGLDYQQMADVLGLPLGTLKSRLFRARLALREQLEAYLGKSGQ